MRRKEYHLTCAKCDRKHATSNAFDVLCTPCAKQEAELQYSALVKDKQSDRGRFTVSLSVKPELWDQLSGSERATLQTWIDQTQGTLQEEMEDRVHFAIKRSIAGAEAHKICLDTLSYQIEGSACCWAR